MYFSNTSLRLMILATFAKNHGVFAFKLRCFLAVTEHDNIKVEKIKLSRGSNLKLQT